MLRWSRASLKPTVYALNLWDTTRMVPYIGTSSARDCIARTFVKAAARKRHTAIGSGRSSASQSRTGKILQISSKARNQPRKAPCIRFSLRISYPAFRCCLKQKKLKEEEGELLQFEELVWRDWHSWIFQTLPAPFIATRQNHRRPSEGKASTWGRRRRRRSSANLWRGLWQQQTFTLREVSRTEEKTVISEIKDTRKDSERAGASGSTTVRSQAIKF